MHKQNEKKDSYGKNFQHQPLRQDDLPVHIDVNADTGQLECEDSQSSYAELARKTLLQVYSDGEPFPDITAAM